jgi:putative ABC transport system permease protein
VELAGEIRVIGTAPVSVAMDVGDPIVNLVVPEKGFSALLNGGIIPRVFWAADSEDSAAYTAAAWDILDEAFGVDAGHHVLDYERTARVNRSLNTLFNVFILGFVGMLSLIAVTSVLGTISTNVKLRMPEFAMLSSVGMTPGGIRRMLGLESLFYGLKALAIGLPLSLLGYSLLYMGFNIKIGFAFVWPWQTMLFSAAAVMLITFGTMRYSAKMLRGANTVELIRKINI